jgi:hypothetical protein
LADFPVASDFISRSLPRRETAKEKEPDSQEITVFKFLAKSSSGGKWARANKAPRLCVEALEIRTVLSATALTTAPLTTAATSSISTAPALLLNNPGNGVTPGTSPPVTPGVALIQSLPDTTVEIVAMADYLRDGYISRNDMMDIFAKGTASYKSATQAVIASFQTLINNASTVGMPGYVQILAGKTLTTANGLLQGLLKGMQQDDPQAYPYFYSHQYIYLAQDIAQGIDNWFLGMDHPDDSFANSKGQTVAPAYQAVDLPLFNPSTGTPAYQDVAQQNLPDCWLTARLAEVADRDPADIMNMIIDNGDNTFTVRFYNNGTPDYVTVDNMLPDQSYGFSDRPQGNLWAALVEKAYAQENASGWVSSNHPYVDSYAALSNGNPQWALTAITGQNVPTYSSINATLIMDAYYQGKFVVLCTGNNPGSSQVDPNHCYALLSYNGATSSFTLFNPWGVNGGTSADNGNYYPGFVTFSCAQLPGAFDSWATAGGASAGSRLAASAAPVQTEVARTVSFVSATRQPQFSEGSVASANASLDAIKLASFAAGKNVAGIASMEVNADAFSKPDLFSTI